MTAMRVGAIIASVCLWVATSVTSPSVVGSGSDRPQTYGVQPEAEGQVYVPDVDRDPYEFCGVSDFGWTDRGVVSRGEQPSAENLRCLRDAGLGAVVNLRKEHPGYDEAAVAQSLGMAYLNIPLRDNTAPTPQQIAEYLLFVDAQRLAKRPVFVHCAGGRGRAGFMDAVYLISNGWLTSDALDRYMHFGLKIDCLHGGMGQIQAIHEVGIALGRGDAWPKGMDNYGNPWEGCQRPSYMDGWVYRSTAATPKDKDSDTQTWLGCNAHVATRPSMAGTAGTAGMAGER